MYCKNCGTSIPDDVIFCPTCGAVQSATGAPTGGGPTETPMRAPTGAPAQKKKTSAGPLFWVGWICLMLGLISVNFVGGAYGNGIGLLLLLISVVINLGIWWKQRREQKKR